jgi:hypothetical protein
MRGALAVPGNRRRPFMHGVSASPATVDAATAMHHGSLPDAVPANENSFQPDTEGPARHLAPTHMCAFAVLVAARRPHRGDRSTPGSRTVVSDPLPRLIDGPQPPVPRPVA